MLHYRLRILRLIVNRISWLEHNIEDTVNKIFQVYWPFTSGNGEENGYAVGVLGWQMLWEAEVLEDLYVTKAESDLTKTQNS